MKNLTFGVNLSPSAAPDADPVAAALRAEDLGYDFVSTNDHPGASRPTYETWTLLTWLAARTTRIKIATRVLGVPFRPPALVAKMAESLDRLSGGRLILGLGGGGSDAELRSFGLGVPTARDKVEALEEAVKIVRALWSSPRVSFEGRHHHTHDAVIEPKPRRRIPIWLGTFGPRALAVTGRVADGWIPTLELAPPAAIPAMRDRIFDAAIRAGRTPQDITLVYNMEFHIGDDAALPPHVVAGSSRQVCDRLAEFAGLGFSAMNFIPAGDEPDRQVARLAQEVLPALRAVVNVAAPAV